MPSMTSDDENVMLVDSPHQVDEVNAEFYNRFPYPWRPQTFEVIDDPTLHVRLLNQHLGDWHHRTVAPRANVWVAGCGTNQGVYTALRFPRGHVVGSDLSPASLAAEEQTAGQLGLNNLELRRESINDVDYDARFDVVVCTGVIHHTADPARALRQIARAMTRGAVLELMVYNRCHRSVCAALQKAVRLLTSAGSTSWSMEDELRMVRRVMDAFKVENSIRELLDGHRTSPEEALADALIQPVEYSYTVESLAALATECGLEMIAPAVTEWDRSEAAAGWHLELADRDLQRHYDGLPDLVRWQITNLMLRERSPMLWFYFQRTDADRPRRSQAAINETFLDTVFERVACTRGHYRLQADGRYTPSSRRLPFPTGLPPAAVADIHARVDGAASMRTILAALDAPTDFGRVLEYRRLLTTAAFPYLVAKAEARPC